MGGLGAAIPRLAPLVPVAVYLIATCVLAWPLLRDVSHALPGPPEDNQQDLWNTWFGLHALDSPSGDLFHTTLVRYPEGASLHHQSYSFPHLFAVHAVRTMLRQPLDLATIVTLHNLAILAALPLAALGARALARRLGADAPGALLAGLLFAFGTYEFGQLQHHVHTSQLQFVPWFVLATLAALEHGRARQLAWAAGLLALCGLSSWYYLAYGGLFLAFEVAWAGVGKGLRGLRAAAIRAAWIGAGALLLVSPWAVPMIRESIGGAVVVASGHDVFVADLASWVAFPAQHLLGDLTAGVRERFTGNPWEVEVYLGLVAVGVFGWAFARRRALGVDERMRWLLSAMIFFAVVATGSSLHVLGRSTVPAPGRLLELVPFVGDARTPARAAAYVQLFLCVGVGISLSALRARLAGAWRRSVATALAGVALAVDVVPLASPMAVTAIRALPAYAPIQRDPDPTFGILDLPLGYHHGNRYLLAQVLHGRPIVAATLSRSGPPTLVDRLALRDLDRLRSQLAEARVKYVVLHLDLLRQMPRGEPGGWFAVAEALAATFPPVYVDGVTAVFQTY